MKRKEGIFFSFDYFKDFTPKEQAHIFRSQGQKQHLLGPKFHLKKRTTFQPITRKKPWHFIEGTHDYTLGPKKGLDPFCGLFQQIKLDPKGDGRNFEPFLGRGLRLEKSSRYDHGKFCLSFGKNRGLLFGKQQISQPSLWPRK